MLFLASRGARELHVTLLLEANSKFESCCGKNGMGALLHPLGVPEKCESDGLVPSRVPTEQWWPNALPLAEVLLDSAPARLPGSPVIGESPLSDRTAREGIRMFLLRENKMLSS